MTDAIKILSPFLVVLFLSSSCFHFMSLSCIKDSAVNLEKKIPKKLFKVVLAKQQRL